MSRYDKLYNYYLNILLNDHYEFISSFDYQRCFVDFTTYPKNNVVKLSEADTYARCQLPSEMSLARLGLSSIWYDSGSVQEMYEMLKSQAMEMGLSDEPRITVLAENMARYTDLQGYQ